MKTNIKLDKKKNNTKAQLKRARPRKQKSNPLPIILISLGGFILLIIVILVAANNNKSTTQNDVASNTVSTTEAQGSGSQFKNETKKASPKTTKATSTDNKNAAKSTATGPELVGYDSNVLKPKGETGTTTQPVETETKKDEAEEKLEESTTSPTENTTTKTAPVSNLPPKEQSIANLKKIGQQYKTYADNHRGHMPIELYQLDLNENDKVSPYTNSQYVMTQEGKGAPLKDSLESIIVREAKAVNGKYLCLLGNGEVRELDAESVEE